MTDQIDPERRKHWEDAYRRYDAHAYRDLATIGMALADSDPYTCGRSEADQSAPAPLTLPRAQVAAVRDMCDQLLGEPAARDAELARLRAERDMLGREADRLRRDWTAMRELAEQAEAEAQRLRAELAALRQVARGYCPACGRGDCAPTVHDWEQERARAERAEAERDELRDEITATVTQLADMAKSRAEQDGAELVRLRARVAELEARDTPSWRQRAEQAEAAAARVRDELSDCDDDAWMVRAGDIRAALNPPKENPDA